MDCNVICDKCEIEPDNYVQLKCRHNLCLVCLAKQINKTKEIK